MTTIAEPAAAPDRSGTRQPIDVVLYGLGPIGCRLGRRLSERPDVRIVGAVDIDPGKQGRSLREVLELPDAADVVVEGSAEAALAGGDGRGVVVHATSSRLLQVVPQLEAVVARGWNVVSTCEELVHPRLIDAALADRLDRAAEAAGVTVLGSGINPGFLLDSLVLVLSGACVRVDAVRVERIVDTNERRIPLQRKAGVGMTESAFRALAESGGIGHVGLAASAYLVAERLGFETSDYSETIEPILASEATATGLGTVPAGGVLGQYQTAVLSAGGKPAVSFTQVMAAGQASVDSIELDGEPPIRQRIDGGVNGDVGTEAVITNLVGPVADAAAGLRIMSEILPLACAGRPRRG
jgi:2,4-diaminopentanoate dehydrogenase